MTNYGNTFDQTITGLESIPLSTALTGTCTVLHTSKSVVGTNTLFTSQIGYSGVTSLTTPTSNASFGYLWDTSSWEARKVVDVYSDTLLYIEEPFTNDLAGATLKYIPASRIKSVTYVDNFGGAKVNNMTLAAGESGGFSGEDYRNNHPEFVLFDGGSTGINVEWSYV